MLVLRKVDKTPNSKRCPPIFSQCNNTAGHILDSYCRHYLHVVLFAWCLGVCVCVCGGGGGGGVCVWWGGRGGGGVVQASTLNCPKFTKVYPFLFIPQAFLAFLKYALPTILKLCEVWVRYVKVFEPTKSMLTLFTEIFQHCIKSAQIISRGSIIKAVPAQNKSLKSVSIIFLLKRTILTENKSPDCK